MSKNIKIIKNCIDLHSDKIIKLYKNIKKINPNNFILFFFKYNPDLKNYKKIKKNNKILYINNKDDEKYNYYFSFNRTNAYLLFTLKFMYKDKIILDIFSVKNYILKNNNKLYKTSIAFSDVYNLKLTELDSELKNIQLKLAETLGEFIDIKLLLINNKN